MSTIESSYYENENFWSGELFEEQDRLRYDFVIKHIDASVRSLLDVGCGNGLFLQRLRCLRPDITVLHGVDRSLAALEHVKVPSSVASADALPFQNGSFDCVTCLEVIEHLPKYIFENALHEISRVSNQQILISVPHTQDLTIGRIECSSCHTLFNPDYHLRSFDSATLAKLFNIHDYRISACEAFGISEEYAMVRQIDALKRNRNNRFPVDVPCPVCGEVLPAVPAENEVRSDTTISSGGLIKERIKAMWPKVDAPRWLLGSYIKM